MKILISIIFLLFADYLFAQEIAIPDYHGDKESLQKVKDKIIRKEVATFTIAGTEEPVSKIKLGEIPLISFGNNFSVFQKDSIKVTLTIGKFHKTNHKIKYLGSYVVKIDNKPFWGTDGGLPKEQINSIHMIVGKDTIHIPKSAYSDLFEPSLSWKELNKTIGNLWVYYSKDRNRFYIAMMNSDGAGAYEVTLIIKNKKYFGRVIDYGF